MLGPVVQHLYVLMCCVQQVPQLPILLCCLNVLGIGRRVHHIHMPPKGLQHMPFPPHLLLSHKQPGLQHLHSLPALVSLSHHHLQVPGECLHLLGG